MHDFGQVCYLDPQKTGSSFVSDFLRRHMALGEVAFEKHRPIDRLQHALPVGKLFFISVRDPLSQYLSLYSFGRQHKVSPLRSALERSGLDVAALYDGSPGGFAAWIEALFEPQNAPTLGHGYTPGLSRLIGLQSFRFLNLSFFEPVKRLHTIGTKDDLEAIYNLHRLHRFILRTETLNADLAFLIGHALRPYLKDPDQALEALAQDSVRVNASPRVDTAETFRIPGDIEIQIREREWFLYKVTAALEQVPQGLLG